MNCSWPQRLLNSSIRAVLFVLEGNPMNLLVTVDENYIEPLKVMLCSYFISNASQKENTVYLLYSEISQEKLEDLREYLSGFGAGFVPLTVPQDYFKGAATSSRYPKEIYYRMLSPLVLPKDLKRVLYLDPDILVLNPLDPLYDLELDGKAFAAASHKGITDMTKNINNIRLDTTHDYFNTGVILFDLEEARKLVNTEEIFDTVRRFEKDLILPDQDIFNILFGNYTREVDDLLWNYDARKYALYLVRSEGKSNVRWIMQNTALLHFCGRHKPWNEDFRNPFGMLYLHYMNLASHKAKKQIRVAEKEGRKDREDLIPEELMIEQA